MQSARLADRVGVGVAVAGGLVGWAADRVAFDLRPLPAAAMRAAPDRNVWVLVAFYALLIVVAAAPWWLGWQVDTVVEGRW